MTDHPDVDVILRWLRGPAAAARWRMHIGDSHLGPPASFVEAVAAGAGEPSASRYGPPAGLPDVRAALASFLEFHHGLEGQVAADRLVVTSGGSMATWAIAATELQPGDSALLLSPHWVIFRHQVAALGAEPIEVPFFDAGRTPAAGEIEALLSAHAQPTTRLLYFANPNNPDGAVIPADVLRALLDVAAARGWAVVSDEVYERVTWEGPVPTAVAAPGRVYTVHSFSKLCSLAGARVGFLTAPVAKVPQVEAHLHRTTFCVPAFLQHAALATLRDAAFEGLQYRTFEESRRRSAAALGVVPPAGGVYHFLHVGDLGLRDGFAVARSLLRDTEVSVAPGAVFGARYADYVRFCFAAAAPDAVVEAAKRVHVWLSEQRG